MFPTSKVLSCLALATLVSVPTLARAQTCAELDLPAPLYGRGHSSLNGVLSQLALLLAEADPPRSLIYKDDGVCPGLASVSDPTLPLSGSAKYWYVDENDGKLRTGACALPDSAEDAAYAAFAISPSDLQPLDCPEVTELPSDILDLLGPVRALSFIVPNGSTQEVISAEAAYHLYTFGGSAGVSPWTEDEYIWSLGGTPWSLSGNQSLFASALGIPHAAFRRTEHNSHWSMIQALGNSVSAGKHEQAIGFISSDAADLNRDKVSPLAYQDFDQLWGYWADSTQNSFDKLNVREGRYSLWHAHHLLTHSAEGRIADEGVAQLAKLLGVDPHQENDAAGLDAIIEAGHIPRCAMRVWRDTDFGPLYGVAPTAPCSCYFEAALAERRPSESGTNCASCTTASDCPNQSYICSYGYCEPG